jgi:hypothetical protein|tara:strand:- start:1143 stop:1382 length:240 start_codon:yes stop_codon:yes gene_type:complete
MSLQVLDSASETTTKVLTIVDKASDFLVVGTILATSGLIMERRTQVVEQEAAKVKQDAGKTYSPATQAKLDLLDQDIPA